MVRISVAGACGRMGSRIIYFANKDQHIELTGVFDLPSCFSEGQDAGIAAGLGYIGVPINTSVENGIKGSNVLIDFTIPEATIKAVEIASELGINIVIGTTGFSPEQLKTIQHHSKQISIVLSPNMSVGMNIMFKLVEDAAKLLGSEYDIELFEIHHRFKKDAPSGTALKLASVLAAATGRNLENDAVYERKGIIGPRADNEIGIQACRLGDVTGDHSVIFGTIGERLEIIHRAHSRDNFALGAIKAARWIADKEPGLYGMNDVLGI